jgi:hypothetical protein
MGTTDDGLDRISRLLLNQLDEMKALEIEKRQTGRSTDEFHELAEKIDDTARHVVKLASGELEEGQDDSPIEVERLEQHPGDWTEGSRNQANVQ